MYNTPCTFYQYCIVFMTMLFNQLLTTISLTIFTKKIIDKIFENDFIHKLPAV